jgi:photosynthetic reaction center cytochrome c subunit
MTKRALIPAGVLALPVLIAACELAPKEGQQLGPRGAGMEQITNLSRVKAVVPPPDSVLPLTTREGQRAGDVYPELKVLGDISIEEFNILMANMTAWVVPADAAPENSGCNYCHNPENMASYEKYTKAVSLRMLQMTRTINTAYRTHVQATGVTCYTCHRGQAVPAHIWYGEADEAPRGVTNVRAGQNAPNPAAAYASLPGGFNATFFAGDRNIRVNTNQIHPTGGPLVPIQDAEHTYGLMMHMSQSLGVNCTFCHNSQNFGKWTTSRLQRVGAWHGIRMVRTVNDQYISPLQTTFPAVGWDGRARLGPLGDPLKVNCTTCHQGLNKPLGGYSMLKDNPSLAETSGPLARAAAAPEPVPVATVGAVVARLPDDKVAVAVMGGPPVTPAALQRARDAVAAAKGEM